MDKSLGILLLLHFWGVFQFTQAQPLPSPHKQSWIRVSSIFFCMGWGKGELQENFEKAALFYEMTEKYEYCITVARTFVHDCHKGSNFKMTIAQNSLKTAIKIIIVT